jgi:protein-S-isoprenylcysteine O-methyltransferase Ste14
LVTPLPDRGSGETNRDGWPQSISLLDCRRSCLVVDSRAMRISIPAVAVPLIVLLLYLVLPGLKEQPWTAVRIGGAILAVIGYTLALTARVQLGKSFSVRPEAKELVSHGLYARIRNPMYVFVDLMVFGLIFALRLYWLLAVLAVLVFMQVRQARREAKVLQEKFGQAYVDYRKRTWF